MLERPHCFYCCTVAHVVLPEAMPILAAHLSTSLATSSPMSLLPRTGASGRADPFSCTTKGVHVMAARAFQPLPHPNPLAMARLTHLLLWSAATASERHIGVPSWLLYTWRRVASHRLTYAVRRRISLRRHIRFAQFSTDKWWRRSLLLCRHSFAHVHAPRVADRRVACIYQWHMADRQHAIARVKRSLNKVQVFRERNVCKWAFLAFWCKSSPQGLGVGK
jgi:hypothetical protein